MGGTLRWSLAVCRGALVPVRGSVAVHCRHEPTRSEPARTVASCRMGCAFGPRADRQGSGVPRECPTSSERSRARCARPYGQTLDSSFAAVLGSVVPPLRSGGGLGREVRGRSRRGAGWAAGARREAAGLACSGCLRVAQREPWSWRGAWHVVSTTAPRCTLYAVSLVHRSCTLVTNPPPSAP